MPGELRRVAALNRECDRDVYNSNAGRRAKHESGQGRGHGARLAQQLGVQGLAEAGVDDGRGDALLRQHVGGGEAGGHHGAVAHQRHVRALPPHAALADLHMHVSVTVIERCSKLREELRWLSHSGV